MGLFLTLALTIGCATAVSASEPFFEPQSPDELMANFERAINEQSVDEYGRTLHRDFTFIFAPGDRSLVEPDTSWGRARELFSMSRLLSGDAGLNYLGQYIPPATAIKFALVPVDGWSWMQGAPDTWTRTYHALLRVEFEDGSRRIVSRRQTFTLTARRSEHDLQPVRFLVLRWQEHGHCACEGRSVGVERARF